VTVRGAADNPISPDPAIRPFPSRTTSERWTACRQPDALVSLARCTPVWECSRAPGPRRTSGNGGSTASAL
jgi:hypothetical protein